MLATTWDVFAWWMVVLLLFSVVGAFALQASGRRRLGCEGGAPGSLRSYVCADARAENGNCRRVAPCLAAGAIAATEGSRGELFGTAGSDVTRREQARIGAERVLAAVDAALPEVIATQVGGVFGDSMIMLTERVDDGLPASTRPTAAIGQIRLIPADVRAAWASRQPYVESLRTSVGRAGGFRAYAPVRNATGPRARRSR